MEQTVEDSASIGRYWRFNGASFVVEDALEQTKQALDDVFRLTVEVAESRRTLRDRYPDWDTGSGEMLLDVQDHLQLTRSRTRASSIVYSSTITATLMAIIHLESMVNYCLFQRFGEEFSEAIERLGLVNRVEIAHTMLQRSAFRGTRPYESLRRLVEWRDLFAHGKNPDIRQKDLAKNHQGTGPFGTTFGTAVGSMIGLLDDYDVVLSHLGTISNNPDDSALYDDWLIRKRVAAIRQFQFTSSGEPLIAATVE